MYKHREKISFLIQLVSFFGSVLFLFYAWFCAKPKTPDYDTYERMMYYKYQNDSLKEVIKNNYNGYYVSPSSR
ncbi:hypothetical protein BH11BAC7_BH11BAC7_21260 [soil metagenome]